MSLSLFPSVVLPPVLPLAAITDRLSIIFPVGVPQRRFIVRLGTARVIFCALYVGAIEGNDRWLAPRHVYRMGDVQGGRTTAAERHDFFEKSPRSMSAWYADNSREQLRDEGVRRGLVPLNAIIEKSGVATTSKHGRYALQGAFAALLDPALSGSALEVAADMWRNTYLTGAALARAAAVRLSASTSAGNTTINLPNGGHVVLPPGASPALTKAVVEEFAPRFLKQPAVVWISDSAVKKYQDTALESVLQIKLDVAKVLPDVILVDLSPPGRTGSLLIVFVEVVASDGPVDEMRKSALLKLLADSPLPYKPDDAAFVTAYNDRGADPVRDALSDLAWGSFAWFASEPDNLVQLHDGTTAARKLAALL